MSYSSKVALTAFALYGLITSYFAIKEYSKDLPKASAFDKIANEHFNSMDLNGDGRQERIFKRNNKIYVQDHDPRTGREQWIVYDVWKNIYGPHKSIGDK